jgi:hypothetical protein
MVLIADCNPTKVVEPSEQPLDFPTATIAAQRPKILRLPPVTTIGSDHLDAIFSQQILVQGITVVGLVSDQPLWIALEKSTVKSVLDKSYLAPRSTFDTYGDRKTRAVCNCHDLGPLALLGFPDTEPPFLAGAKVPSIKASDKSISPRFSKSSARARRILSTVPSCAHCWKRRWQVWYDGYLSGRSFQGAPVRNTQRIPLRTSRASRHGRPRPSLRRGGLGINGSNKCHCSSVRSIEEMIHSHNPLVQYQVATIGDLGLSSFPIYETASKVDDPNGCLALSR